ncbi:MAG TPA: alpha-N-acetylglucosaminidase [Luteolibacter sp.]|nr:alpha-N-acetylglucosaminidase [Luteolibacter sp.]
MNSIFPTRLPAIILISAGLLTLSYADTSPTSAKPGASRDGVAGATALIDRVLPGQASLFTCELIAPDQGRDVFELEAVNNRIVLRGNNGVSLAMAFNWYLRYTACMNYDWMASGPLVVSGKLPLPAVKVRQGCAARERFFLNYCTYGYTMPWWDAAQWERFVDWMAMNGINRPLLQAGTEAVWLEVWKSYGLPEDQIRNYFGGPAHLPWHRMANHDKWGGPLPVSYIEGQKVLQRKILAQARALGMRPILSAFAGHVPELLKKVRPDASITRINPGWGHMSANYTTWFLSPKDPLFKEIQGTFIQKLKEIYGTDHLYAADPFNEIKPPSWEPEYLASVSKTIYETMAMADPDAVWYQMSWTFYHRRNWTEPRLAAMTKAVPPGKLVYLDYVCDEVEFYQRSKQFYGAPFIWCYLGNFGGNTHLVAPLNKIQTRMKDALKVNNCIGVGSTLEGLNVNPIAYDLVLEQPWHTDGGVTMEDWVKAYATRRAGRPDAAVIAAWQQLASRVLLDTGVGIWGHGIAFQAQPSITLPPWGFTNPENPYQNKDLVLAIDKLLEADPACRMADGYQFDLVNLVRQALGNCTLPLYQAMIKAIQDKDLAAFQKASGRFMEIGADLDVLLATRHEFLLGTWISDARKWGATPSEQDYYERNARQIISTWHSAGGHLSDYANRQLSGMLSSYYAPRWQKFIDLAAAGLAAGKPVDMASYNRWRGTFDGTWANTTSQAFAAKPQGDPCATAERLFRKYRQEMNH